VVIQTDHKPLITIFKKPLHSAPKRLQRMLLKLQRFNLEFEYIKGSENHLADLLSRVKGTEETPGTCESKEYVFRLEVENINTQKLTCMKDASLSEIRNATSQDQELQQLEKVIQNGWPEKKDTLPAELHQYWN
jgi:hypothetical protein